LKFLTVTEHLEILYFPESYPPWLKLNLFMYKQFSMSTVDLKKLG